MALWPGQYPTPNKNNAPPELEEDYDNALPIYVFSKNQFPPEPRKQADGWPYDSNTKNLMDPHSKGRRSLTTALGHSDGSPSRRAGNEPGIQGNGTFQKLQGSHTDGSMADSGGSVTVHGYAGWSSSPQGKEFDMPEGLDDNNMHTTQANPKGGLSKAPVVFFGGLNPGRKMRTKDQIDICRMKR